VVVVHPVVAVVQKDWEAAERTAVVAVVGVKKDSEAADRTAAAVGVVGARQGVVVAVAELHTAEEEDPVEHNGPVLHVPVDAVMGVGVVVDAALGTACCFHQSWVGAAAAAAVPSFVVAESGAACWEEIVVVAVAAASSVVVAVVVAAAAGPTAGKAAQMAFALVLKEVSKQWWATSRRLASEPALFVDTVADDQTSVAVAGDESSQSMGAPQWAVACNL
jgi:hypothetical protein